MSKHLSFLIYRWATVAGFGRGREGSGLQGCSGSSGQIRCFGKCKNKFRIEANSAQIKISRQHQFCKQNFECFLKGNLQRLLKNLVYAFGISWLGVGVHFRNQLRKDRVGLRHCRRFPVVSMSTLSACRREVHGSPRGCFPRFQSSRPDSAFRKHQSSDD